MNMCSDKIKPALNDTANGPKNDATIGHKWHCQRIFSGTFL